MTTFNPNILNNPPMNTWENLKGILSAQEINNQIGSLEKLQETVSSAGNSEKLKIVTDQYFRFKKLIIRRAELADLMNQRTDKEAEWKASKSNLDKASIQKIEKEIDELSAQITKIENERLLLEQAIVTVKTEILSIQNETQVHQPVIDQISQQYAAAPGAQTGIIPAEPVQQEYVIPGAYATSRSTADMSGGNTRSIEGSTSQKSPELSKLENDRKAMGSEYLRLKQAGAKKLVLDEIESDIAKLDALIKQHNTAPVTDTRPPEEIAKTGSRIGKQVETSWNTRTDIDGSIMQPDTTQMGVVHESQTMEDSNTVSSIKTQDVIASPGGEQVVVASLEQTDSLESRLSDARKNFVMATRAKDLGITISVEQYNAYKNQYYSLQSERLNATTDPVARSMFIKLEDLARLEELKQSGLEERKTTADKVCNLMGTLGQMVNIKGKIFGAPAKFTGDVIAAGLKKFGVPADKAEWIAPFVGRSLVAGGLALVGGATGGAVAGAVGMAALLGPVIATTAEMVDQALIKHIIRDTKDSDISKSLEGSHINNASLIMQAENAAMEQRKNNSGKARAFIKTLFSAGAGYAVGHYAPGAFEHKVYDCPPGDNMVAEIPAPLPNTETSAPAPEVQPPAHNTPENLYARNEIRTNFDESSKYEEPMVPVTKTPAPATEPHSTFIVKELPKVDNNTSHSTNTTTTIINRTETTGNHATFGDIAYKTIDKGIDVFLGRTQGQQGTWGTSSDNSSMGAGNESTATNNPNLGTDNDPAPVVIKPGNPQSGGGSGTTASTTASTGGPFSGDAGLGLIAKLTGKR